MTPAEYVQLKAFARIDGLLLSLFWIGGFACSVVGLTNPNWSLVALILVLSSPFFMARRLRLFRDEAREGTISFLRGWAYVILAFFYAGLLFALAQYAYLAFLDHGYLFQTIISSMQTPEAEAVIKQYGMGDMVSESIHEMQRLRPIDIALNMLTTNIMIGVVVGVPIAAVMKSSVLRADNNQDA